MGNEICDDCYLVILNGVWMKHLLLKHNGFLLDLCHDNPEIENCNSIPFDGKIVKVSFFVQCTKMQLLTLQKGYLPNLLVKFGLCEKHTKFEKTLRKFLCASQKV